MTSDLCAQPRADYTNRPKANLCQFNFVEGHECMFGPENCIYAHSIQHIPETDPNFLKSMTSKKRKSLFNNLGIWPTTAILEFFTPTEIIEISRVNKEAHYISKKIFGMRAVALDKINIRTVMLFRRAEKLIVNNNSLNFFMQYKDVFFEEILAHYYRISKLIINLNTLFDVRQKDYLFDKLASFELRPTIDTLLIQNSMLTNRNLDSLLRTQFTQKVLQLKLPQNNLGDSGVNFLFCSGRLQQIKKLDLSSNLITMHGAEIIAVSHSLPRLQSLNLSFNKIGDQGFIFLVQSKSYPTLLELKLDANQIDQTGAQTLQYGCGFGELRNLSISQNGFKTKGCQLIQIYPLRNMRVLKMSRCDIMNEGVASLAAASYFRNL